MSTHIWKREQQDRHPRHGIHITKPIHEIQFLIGDDLDSDHLPIEITIDAQPHRNIHTNPIRYKFNQTDREVFESTLKVALHSGGVPKLSLPRILISMLTLSLLLSALQ